MRRFRLPTIGAFGPSVLFYSLLRIPSFFEPHWYTDEAGYATTAREMLRGKLLYVDIWNNKPPLHLWTVAAIVRIFGSGEVAFHLTTYVFGLLTLHNDRWPRWGSRSGPKQSSNLKSHWFQRDLRIVGSTDRHLSQIFHPGIHAWFIWMTS